MSQPSSVALVTGATSGIGRATALALARSGRPVAAVGRDTAALARLCEEGGPGVRVFPADLLELDRIPALVERVTAACGPVGGLVNSAGVIATGAVADTDDAALERMMRLNLRAPYALMRACLPGLQSVEGGAVVNVSSVAGLRPFPNLSAYCVSKAALDHLTRSAAIEWAPLGVRVNAVNPGVVRTELHRRGGMDEAAYAGFLKRTVQAHPLGRVGEPDEIAHLILTLLSVETGWITGETIAVDGGRHLTAAR